MVLLSRHGFTVVPESGQEEQPRRHRQQLRPRQCPSRSSGTRAPHCTTTSFLDLRSICVLTFLALVSRARSTLLCEPVSWMRPLRRSCRHFRLPSRKPPMPQKRACTFETCSTMMRERRNGRRPYATTGLAPSRPIPAASRTKTTRRCLGAPSPAVTSPASRFLAHHRHRSTPTRSHAWSVASCRTDRVQWSLPSHPCRLHLQAGASTEFPAFRQCDPSPGRAPAHLPFPRTPSRRPVQDRRRHPSRTSNRTVGTLRRAPLLTTLASSRTSGMRTARNRINAPTRFRPGPPSRVCRRTARHDCPDPLALHPRRQTVWSGHRRTGLRSPERNLPLFDFPLFVNVS